jgi:superfamily I DNA and RNA helicase
MGKPKQSYYDLLTARRLARGVRWAIETDDPDAILLETVARFKGLEATIVVLWLGPVIDEAHDREGLYVGMSRGKSRVYVVGSAVLCSSVLKVGRDGER